MKHFPFTGNDEYVYDMTTNILHYCKYLTEDCHIDHLAPNNSFLIPSYSKEPALEVINKVDKVPVKCSHCFRQ